MANWHFFYYLIEICQSTHCETPLCLTNSSLLCFNMSSEIPQGATSTCDWLRSSLHSLMDEDMDGMII